MTKLFLTPYAHNEPENKEIIVQTFEGNPLMNSRPSYISFFEKNQERTVSKYPHIIARTPPTCYYNCHGMTLAGRRTCISEASEVYKALEEDKYVEIDSNDILPGDLVLYIEEDGDVEHSAIVVSVDRTQSIALITVISKWSKAGEYIHRLHDSPYKSETKKFYRIKHEPVYEQPSK